MRRITLSLLAILGLVLLSRGWSFAADPTPGSDAKKIYLKYCGSCHGLDGKGDGPTGKHMSPPPTNLTLLSKQNGGKFPDERVLQVLLLHADVPAHGFEEMPVWGDGLSILDQIGPVGSGASNRGKIELLTQYLHSIQQK